MPAAGPICQTFPPPLSPGAAAFLAGSRERVKEVLSSPKLENWTHAFFELYAALPLPQRQARAFAYTLVNTPIYLLPDEQLVGQIYQKVPGAGAIDAGGWNLEEYGHPELAAYSHAARRVAAELPELCALSGAGDSWVTPLGCSPGHVGWHWDWIVRDGVSSMLARIEAAAPEADAKGRETLDAMRICLEAVLTWNDHHVDALQAQLEGTTEPAKRAAIETKIATCQRVPRHGARTFREAVQAYHFSYLATIFENPHGGNGPGRLDFHLWPYLKRDLAEGIETLDSARELVCELFVRVHERLSHNSDGWVETIVVGGCDREGRCAASPLSRIMVEAIAALGITHPSVYIRIPEDASEDILTLAVQDLVHGGNRAQVVSDSAIIAAMTKDGHMPVEDARMFMCGGCMEISPHGMNSDLLFTGFFNTCKVLNLVINGGVCLNTGRTVLRGHDRQLPDFATFEDLYQTVERTLDHILTLTFKRADIASEVWGETRPRFLLSSQIEDCIARGRVIHAGGARYEDYGSTPLGIPNLADSLFAIKQAVFDQHFVSPKELLEALRADFAGAEPLRRRLDALPKYGQGHADADAMMQRVVNSVCDPYERFVTRFNGRVKPMIMTFTMAPTTGRALGATADGRHAKTPIAQGLTPQNRAMTKGITTALQSLNALPLDRFSGGAASMWDLAPEFATPPIVESILRTFLETGGQMFQGNMTDVRELERALEMPEDYPHLMVRVGGYSARFVALTPELQTDVITRQRHAR